MWNPRLALLLALYFAQGLPYGFQVTALPVYLRTQGVSLTSIGFVGTLALPWMLKALWAPLVDRFGAYRQWILVMQAALIVTAIGAAFAEPLWLLLTCVGAMNLFAATQDIATDGWAVRSLEAKELGRANAIQVVGYKLGMLTGGGLLAWASGTLGWRGLFFSMAGAMACVWLLTLRARDAGGSVERVSLGEIGGRLWQAARARGTLLLLVAVGTYKVGEYMVSAMFKPFVVDHGFTIQQVGLWVGTYGMIASLLGSLLGGELARRWSLTSAVTIAAAIRVLPLGGAWLLARSAVSTESVVLVTCAEHFGAGMITTAMFAFMMSRVDRRIGATHYTLLASVEVLGKSPPVWASGWLAERYGYDALFLLGAALSLAFLVYWVALLRFGRPASVD